MFKITDSDLPQAQSIPFVSGPCVVQLMEHVLSTLKREHPEIKSAFYRQDNAGCYHAANTILACKDISQRSGIFIPQLDFSDPQGGKGACDRFAATMKNHVRSFVNEGKTSLQQSNFFLQLPHDVERLH